MSAASRMYRAVAIVVVLSLLGQPILLPGRVLAAAQPMKSMLQMARALPRAGPPSLPNLAATLPDPAPLPETLALPGPFPRVYPSLGAALQAGYPSEPVALACPIAISRIQSTYQVGGTAVISFTVTNNLPPVSYPDIPDGATVTETADILGALDVADDPNTIRDVTVVDTLTLATYLSAGQLPDRQGQTLVWNVGELPPQASHTISFTVQLPGSAGDFVELDSGATTYGAHQGRLVEAQAAPAQLAPDGYGQWLIWTPDANIYDEHMLRQVAELGQDPAALFAYVRGFGFEAYTGSLRGTRGTLWSEAGNSADQASLLIAMLRASGIPARYRHGTLDTAGAQTLITSMFPTPVEVAGHLPAGSELSDPANDPGLIAEVQDHWWVEAYLPAGAGWTELDPSFAAANPGQRFATPAEDGTDQIAELPDSVRHKVTLTLEIERYESFPIGGLNLSQATPLSATFNAVSLAGAPINVGFMVETQTEGTAIYHNIYHTYTPYFEVADLGIATVGDAFGDFLTNFPLSSYFVTGVWLYVEQQDPQGNVETDKRELVDLIGPAARQGGGEVTLPPRGEEPLLGYGNVIQVQVLTHSAVPQSELDRLAAALLAGAPDVAQAWVEYEAIDQEDPDASQQHLEEHWPPVLGAHQTLLQLMGTVYYAAATAPERQLDEEALLVKSYPDEPKVLLVAQTSFSGTESLSFELLDDRERAIAYPGQAEAAAAAATLQRTIGDKVLEVQFMEQWTGAPPESGLTTFLAANESGIPLALITAGTLSILDDLDISEEAKGRITEAVNQGLMVYVPQEMATMEAGPAIGWVEVDAEGTASFVTENGGRAAIEYDKLASMVLTYLQPLAFEQGFWATIMIFFGLFIESLVTSPGSIKDRIGDAIEALCKATALALATCAEASMAMPQCATGVIAAQLLISSYLIAAMTYAFAVDDPSLLPTLHEPNYIPPPAEPIATERVAYAAQTAATTLAVDAATDHLSIVGPVSLTWSDSGVHGFAFDTLTAPDAVLYEGGSLLAAGSLEVSGVGQPGGLQGNPLDLALDALGSQTFAAAAAPGLGSGTAWETYSATLAAASPFTLTLEGAAATVGGTGPYTGTVTAIVQDGAQVTGTGHSPVPQFAASTTVNTLDAQLLLGGLQGTVQAGGAPFAAPNGLAVAGHSGAVAISEASDTTDQVTLSGAVGFFTLDVLPSATSIDPTQIAILVPDVYANFSDTYTLTASAPEGWHVEIAGNGQISARPPAEAATGTYRLLVTAQSGLYPDLFAPAVVEITLTAVEAMALSVVEEPNITVPMGEVLDPEASVPGIRGHLVNGRAEVPEAAYNIVVTNSATSDHTYDITVAGLPAGWAVLSQGGQTTGTSLGLGAGQVGIVGLYISPTQTAILDPGITHSFTVTAIAQDNGTLSASESLSFVMPSLAFPYPQVVPVLDYAAPGTPAQFEARLTNVGNVTGTLPATVTAFASPYLAAPIEPNPITSAETWTTPSLAPGETDTQTVSLDTTSMALGEFYFVSLSSVSGEYRPEAYFALQAAGPDSSRLFEASDEVVGCGGDALEGALYGLGQALLDLEISCDAGSCDDGDQDQVVAAAGALVDQANLAYPEIDTGDLEAGADGLAAASDDTAIGTAMGELSAAAADLVIPVCEITAHQPAARFTPTYNAVLLGGTETYTLTVTNEGAVSTTYAITTELLSGPTTTVAMLDPGQSQQLAYPITPTALGTYYLLATVVATGTQVSSDVRAAAQAGVHVVDRFVQLTAVRPDPAFVETGTSSTTIHVDVTNIANIALDTTARTVVLAPSASVSYTADLPLTVLAGNPRSYELVDVDTSGWAEGVYTVSVELLDDDLVLIPDGSGYGYLGAGQALGASHAINPSMVAPGTVTVTTFITTEILAETILPESAPSSDTAWVPVDRTGNEGPLPETEGTLPAGRWRESILTGRTDSNLASSLAITPARPRPQSAGTGEEDASASLEAWIQNEITGVIRYEEDDPALLYNGVPLTQTVATWSRQGLTRASRGYAARSLTMSDTASLTFEGTWVGVGFLTGKFSGLAEVFIDGASQGTVDTYTRVDDVASRYYDGLVSGTHTISVTVLGTRNDFSLNNYVYLDYIDIWDGTSLVTGTFEAELGNEERLIFSGGWANEPNGTASDGAYLRNGQTVWFPFTGSSVTYQSLAYWLGGTVKVHIDGALQGYFSLYSPADITRTVSFGDLGEGPHVLQVRAYRGQANVDTFTTPGSPPFYEPPTPTGIIRYEEDDPALLYNGVPYTRTATTWSGESDNRASRRYAARSLTMSDTVSLTFDGTWVGVGFLTGRFSGLAEVFIDGASQGTVDTYTRVDDVTSHYYDGLVSGTHTISVTVLGTRNDFSLNNYVYVDYMDLWDGTSLVTGTFEAELGNEERLILGGGWANEPNGTASDGAYLRNGATMWFPFTGSSVTYQSLAYWLGGTVKVHIDGALQGYFSLYSPADISRTVSFGDLGEGPHVLQVRAYRGQANVDTFTTPGTAPFFDPSRSGVVRYEEDDPALRYGGAPPIQRPLSWVIEEYTRASRSYAARSNTLSDTISLTFDGPWASIGFLTASNGGKAKIFVDGTSQGTVDTYSASDDALEVVYDGLVSDTHTISVTVLLTHSASSGGDWIRVDYIDAWDGKEIADGWYEADRTYQDNDRVDLSGGWSPKSDAAARGGLYYENGQNVWFRFTGDSVTYLAMTDRNAAASAEILIDGVSQGQADLSYALSDSPLPFHYSGLGGGAHVMRVRGLAYTGADAFEAEPTDLHPGVPMAEWLHLATDGGPQFVLSTIAAGDLDGDGVVELVVPTYKTGASLYVYRGDGVDTGSGSPLLWSKVVGAAAEPAVADLDGDGDAEIVVIGEYGLYALHHDGSTYWYTSTVTSTWGDGGGTYGWGGPAIGNMDGEPGPEIVVAAHNTCLCVFDGDGTKLFDEPIGQKPTVPVLADLTGDGYLDILVAQDNTLKLYDYAGGGTLAWSRTVTGTIFVDSWGPPAVGDLDGHLAGGDLGPEIAWGWDGYIGLFDEDGTLMWAYATAGRYASSISLADVNGDGIIEIIGTMGAMGGGKQRIHVLDPEGTLLWSADVSDSTASTSGTSVHDLDGNGTWEVIWNGVGTGLTVFQGTDGSVLYNEPYINSGTLLDYPAIADVDGDGHAEILAGDDQGIYVVGYDNVWAASRPLWGSHNYHITEINDDLSVPPAEPNSWEVHNTYRTQTALTNPAPSYHIVLTHTAAVTGVTVLTSTFNVSPTYQADPQYGWDYGQQWYEPVVTRTFESELAGLLPGESRRVAEGTEVAYRLASGTNRLALPPLYASASHIVAVSPATQSAGGGGSVVYDVTLSNPASASDTYSLTVTGLPAGWFTLVATVALAGHAEATVPLTVTVPADSQAGTLDFAVMVTNTSGGRDQAAASLVLIEAVDVDLSPAERSVRSGEFAAYTLTITNHEAVARTYELAATGLAEVSLPPTVTVPATSAQIVAVEAVAYTQGTHAFTVSASGPVGSDLDSAVLNTAGRLAVGLDLAPDVGYGGPAAPAVYTAMVSNLGDVPDSYDLSVDVPPGWSYQLAANGAEVASVALSPHVFASADLRLMVTPDAAAVVGSYPFTLTAESETAPGVRATATATLEVTDRGVQVSIAPASTTLDPRDAGAWQVTVTNTGSQEDTYDLSASGFLGPWAELSANPVTLDSGQSLPVDLTADGLGLILPGTYPFAVTATSQVDGRIRGEDTAQVTIEGFEAVEVSWVPSSQTVNGTLTAGFLLVVSNTGNVPAIYQLALDSGDVRAKLPLGEILIPPHVNATLALGVEAPQGGTFILEGTASSANATGSGTATLTVVFDNEPPLADAGPDQTVAVDTTVTLDGGNSSDPDGDLPLSYAWTQTGGQMVVSLSDNAAVSPAFVAPAAACVLTFTLIVIDSRGMIGPMPDTVVITVSETLYDYHVYLPLIRRE